MANVNGLGGHNPNNGLPILFAAYGNDIVNLSSAVGYSMNLTPTAKVEFANFLDNQFAANGFEFKRYNNTTWLDEVTRKHAPIGKYLLPTKNRLFMASVKFGTNTMQSRIAYSDLPVNGDITYGLEYGADLAQTASSAVVSSASAYFKARNIKVGDPFVIVDGANAGEYNVQSVDSEYQITLTEALTYSASSSSYWVSRNYIDVNINDGDVLTGIGENSNRVLAFKRRSVHVYDGVLRRLRGVPGTTSHRSIVTIDQQTFWYAPKRGIFLAEGLDARLISRGVQEYIDGVDPANESNIVGWPVNGEIYRVYLGNVSNSETGLMVNNCILDYDTATQTWSPGQLDDVVRCKTSWISSDEEKVYLGNDSGQIFQDNMGTSDAGTSIAWGAETGFSFPLGPHIETEMVRAEIHAERGRGVKVAYKLYGFPDSVDTNWRPLGDLESQITDLPLERRAERFARGINIKFSEESINPGPIITRVDIFHKPRTMRKLADDE